MAAKFVYQRSFSRKLFFGWGVLTSGVSFLGQGLGFGSRQTTSGRGQMDPAVHFSFTSFRSNTQQSCLSSHSWRLVNIVQMRRQADALNETVGSQDDVWFWLSFRGTQPRKFVLQQVILRPRRLTQTAVAVFLFSFPKCDAKCFCTFSRGFV